VVVEARGLEKTFRIPTHRVDSLKERILRPYSSGDVRTLRALDSVSFEIHQGEFFGIVGRNGSGKSTLLKLLASIYKADGGRLRMAGRLAPFIELGVGFNPELTARENVLLNGVMMGLTPQQTRERFDSVIEFAELEEFVDLKLKNYSSGMLVRLAFSAMLQADADVLLIDEVLAVGDLAFQQKCFDLFLKMKAAGRTIVFVTHDMHAVERFCNRAMLLERGSIVDIGDPHQIALAYNEINFGRYVHGDDAGGRRYGDQSEAEITAAWFEDRAGERVQALGQGAPVRLAMEVRFREALEEPVFGFTLRHDAGQAAFATRTDMRQVPTGRFEAGDVAVVRVTLDNWLAPGRYRLTPSLARAGAGLEALDAREDLTMLTVHGTGNAGGLVDLPHEFEIERP
jgi:ABC-type polysaccharide/polyol phosphate transport system ATPase subunit